MSAQGEVANALHAVFVSPNVIDSNLEPANLVDTTSRMAGGLFAIAKAINNLAAAVRGESIPD